jgi:hypothetical protein
MIAAIATLLVRAKVPSSWARPMAWLLIAVIGALLIWWGWTHWLARHDQAVVATDRAAGTTAVLTNVIEADRAAGAAKDIRDRDFAADQTNLQEKADAAADNGTSPLDALFDELR